MADNARHRSTSVARSRSTSDTRGTPDKFLGVRSPTILRKAFTHLTLIAQFDLSCNPASFSAVCRRYIACKSHPVSGVLLAECCLSPLIGVCQGYIDVSAPVEAVLGWRGSNYAGNFSVFLSSQALVLPESPVSGAVAPY
jgi:hypothetical protein